MRTPLLAVLALGTTSPLLAQSAEWPTWRGPTDNGVAAEGAAPPLEWGEKRNVRWKIELPGLGASTPIVRGDRLYLTSAVPASGEQAEGELSRPAQVPHRLLVLAYDRATGKQAWRTVVGEATPHEKLHETSTLASASAITDGERIYAFFGSHGVYALDLAGEVLWSKDLGRMKTLAEFGEGATPALSGDTLVVPWDHEEDSALIALDARTGDVRWKRPRAVDSSWGSPTIVSVGDMQAVIVSGSGATCAYALADGSPLWSCGGMSKNPVNSPTVADGVLFVMNSYKGKVVQAVKLDGAEGDVSGTEKVLWTHVKSASYVPNPIVVGDLLFFLRDSTGILNCLDARTGEEHFYGERLGDLDRIHSSPVAAAGRLYIASRDGDVAVVKAGAEFELLAVNQLDDCFEASPVVVGDELFLRGRRHLYCLAEK